MTPQPIIAIDGPAGAGKSTIAKALARRLGYLFINTGAMYRAVAWKALRQGVPVEDAARVGALAAEAALASLLWLAVKRIPFPRALASVLLVVGLGWFLLRLRN